MSEQDFLRRFVFDKAPVRGEYIHLEESLQTILSQHAYPAPLKRLLGEALCVAGLLTSIIKFQGRLSVQFRGKGQLKFLLAQCNNDFQLRGLAKWEGEITEQALEEALQDGVLAIILDSGLAKGSYQGIVAWQGHSLAESIEGYFKHSEQLATKLWLNTNGKVGVGLLLQVIPASEGITHLEKAAVQPHWHRITQLTESLNLTDLIRLDYETLLTHLYADEEVRVFPAISLSFKCTCTRRRGEEAIALLGREEAEQELREHHSIVVTCDFCNKEYLFDRIDVAKIFEDKDYYPPHTQLH